MAVEKCPRCGYHLAEQVRWGCHCDLEEDMEPDKCVLDTNEPHFCTFAKQLIHDVRSKEQCEYWRKW